MLKFKKYSSIENAITRDFMERVRAEMPADLEWVVQEKVHGSNILGLPLCGSGFFANFAI